MELSYKTRGNKSAQGLQKIFFASHPAERECFLDAIAGELLALHDAAVFYAPEEGEISQDLLLQMQLVVLPVTRRLLREPSAARDSILPMALAARLPILPIMQEQGLAAEFSRVFGNLQYLDGVTEDETAISYDQKLRRFLDAILLGDEQIQRVRAAFDAYIFLSYRKKDRAHAQELMRLIHRNDFCRDIAIWYDEFLVPGEDFNEAITRALCQSALFALVVTPNLVNEPNYVMDVEYPMARAEGKPILPLVARPTDRALLENCYQGIPEGVDGRDEDAVAMLLRRAVGNLALGEAKNDPAHLFFIGLAYLGGIDVEVDRERGLSLITRAAEAGLVEAMYKLASMYECGDGVARDVEIALSWRERIIELRLAAYRNSKSKNTAHAVLVALGQLLERQREQLRWSDAEKTCLRMEKLLVEVRSLGISYYRRFDVLIPYYYATACLAESKYGEAEAYCRRALSAAQLIDGEADADGDVSALYETLGRCAEARGEIRAARGHYEKSIACSAAVEEQKKNGAANRAVDYVHLIDLSVAEGDLAAAGAYLTRAREIADSRLLYDEGLHAQRTLSTVYERAGWLAYHGGRVQEAEGFYLQSLSVLEALYEKHRLEGELGSILIRKAMLGELLMIENRSEEALRHYEEGLAIAERIYSFSKTREALLSVLRLARGCYSIAWRLEDRERTGSASRYMNSLMERMRREDCNREERFELAECYRAMGVHAFSLDDGDRQAEENFTAAYRIICELLETDERVICRERSVELGAQIGLSLFLRGRPLRGGTYLRRAVAEGEALLENGCTNNGRDSAALAYFHRAFIPSRRAAVYARRAEEIWKQLCAACPEVPLYQARLEILYETAKEMGWELC